MIHCIVRLYGKQVPFLDPCLFGNLPLEVGDLVIGSSSLPKAVQAA